MPAKAFQPSANLGFNLAAIGVMVAAGALALAYGIDGLSRLRGDTPARDDTMLVRNIAGQTLTIPAGWMRLGREDRESFASQIDLRLELSTGQVDVTLLPRSRARASARLLDGVYLHQFMPNEVEGPAGLVGKPLYPTDGFEGETVWYDPLSGDPFVAKCAAPLEKGGEAHCLRTVILPSGLAAVYSFGASALVSWRQFDAEMAVPLKKIGALQAPL